MKKTWTRSGRPFALDPDASDHGYAIDHPEAYQISAETGLQRATIAQRVSLCRGAGYVGDDPTAYRNRAIPDFVGKNQPGVAQNGFAVARRHVHDALSAAGRMRERGT